jgi:hypothetical protein
VPAARCTGCSSTSCWATRRSRSLLAPRASHMVRAPES